MGFEADITDDWEASLAALAWQFDCGVDEAMGETAVNRYEVVAEQPAPRASAAAVSGPAGTRVAAQAGGREAPRPAARAEPAPPPPERDPVAEATLLAGQAGTIEALRAAIERFELCELKQGARSAVFADGNPAARVMVLGEAPGRDELREGLPFAGSAALLLRKMFAAIGLSAEDPDPSRSLYLANAIFWPTPGYLAPDPADIAMLRPFVARHIALADPDVIVVMGQVPLESLTGQGGLIRRRGKWAEALGRPVLPMVHPGELLKNPAGKADAWADLLKLQAFLTRGQRDGD